MDDKQPPSLAVTVLSAFGNATVDAMKGVKTIIDGAAEAWFGPSNPITPTAQETKGRSTDFQVAQNINYTPRSQEPIGFLELRTLAYNYDLLRLCIETKKDQLIAQRWGFRYRDQSLKDKNPDNDRKLAGIRDIFAIPDGVWPFPIFYRALIEDQLVCDAPCVEPLLTRAGGLRGFQWVDGATIKVLIDGNGRRPFPPDPAYQQILKGVPANNLTSDDIVYMPRNMRTNHFYGMSPVEQIILSVNTGLRRALTKLEYYTEGTVPDAFMMVPEGWDQDQINHAQKTFDSLLVNTEQRRKVRFMPGGPGAQIVQTKEILLKDDYDEWLARIVCYALSVTPTPFIRQMNRATADTAKSEIREEGTQPQLMYWEAFFNTIIWKYYSKDVEIYANLDEELDPAIRAKIHQIYSTSGIMLNDEIREELGKAAFTPEQRQLSDEQKGKPIGGGFGGDEAVDKVAGKKKLLRY
jgi:hypothetical protein